MDQGKRVCCAWCGTLLAIKDGSRVRLKLREMQYVIEGRDLRTTTVCRKCHRLNEF